MNSPKSRALRFGFHLAAVLFLGSELAGIGLAAAEPESAPGTMKKIEVVGRPLDVRSVKRKDAKEKGRRVEMTGSRIRVKEPTARDIQHADSQIQVMDQTQIRRTGRADLAGVLSNLPSVR